MRERLCCGLKGWDDAVFAVKMGGLTGQVTAMLSIDPIALDVDNGPLGLTQDANDWLYSDAGLAGGREGGSRSGPTAGWDSGPPRRTRRSADA